MQKGSAEEICIGLSWYGSAATGSGEEVPGRSMKNKHGGGAWRRAQNRSVKQSR